MWSIWSLFAGAIVSLLCLGGILFTMHGNRTLRRDDQKAVEAAWRAFYEDRKHAYHHQVRPWHGRGAVLPKQHAETTKLEDDVETTELRGDDRVIKTIVHRTHRHSWVEVRLNMTGEMVGRFCTDCNKEEREPGWD